MRQVISLVGRDAGHTIWMNNPQAEAAVATGAACWPEDAGKMSVKGTRIDAADLPDDDEASREQLRLRMDEDRRTVLVGAWPKKAILSPKVMHSNMVESFPSGTIIITVGGRKATYQTQRQSRSGEWFIDLREVHDLSEPDAATEAAAPVTDNVVLPPDWRDMHWRQQASLASEIIGESVGNKADAVAVLEAYEADRAV